jgi:chorismate mutase/prephenate dehydratase
MKMGAEEKIKILRQKIETIDSQILRLLNERAGVAGEVGRVKSEVNMDPYSPQREEEVLKRLNSQNPGPFPQGAIAPVFREIISACRSLEVELTVVYLGPPATYAHLACIERFGSSIRALPEESIQEVFEAVERRKANYGVVPIENSTEGVVNRTLDMFIDSELKICGEILLRISHDLLSRSGDSKDIDRIYSHPQALAQCRQWLRINLPQVPLVETTSTAKAAQMAAEDPKAAAIASPFASHLYGLKAIESQIEDYFHNYTRFLVLGSQMSDRTGKDKTSLLFSISHSPGSLYRMLRPFSEKSINLTKIESRPIKDKPWEYVFFLDFEGHAMDSPIHEAVNELKKNVLFLKFLGSYPRSS